MSGILANPRRFCLAAAAVLFAVNALQRLGGQKPGGRWSYMSAGLGLLSAAMLLPDAGDTDGG
ncbi:MAG: hypothetical protein H0V51_02040 [Chloroflexi bacterium]|nr:hypothetical protein [Chloroflexota bacterium]